MDARGQDQPKAEERRQRPEGIPGISGDEPWQDVGVTAGTDTQETCQSDQADLDQRVSSSFRHGAKTEFNGGSLDISASDHFLLAPVAPATVLPHPRKPLFAFANVFYASGVCLSTNLVSVVRAELGQAKATDQPSLLIDDFANGTDGWATSSPATDSMPPVPNLLTAAVGPEGKPGITVTRPVALTTHKLGDPKWRGPEDARLQFQIHSTANSDGCLVVEAEIEGTGFQGMNGHQPRLAR